VKEVMAYCFGHVGGLDAFQTNGAFQLFRVCIFGIFLHHLLALAGDDAAHTASASAF
jgi:hypothetical protein